MKMEQLNEEREGQKSSLEEQLIQCLLRLMDNIKGMRAYEMRLAAEDLASQMAKVGQLPLGEAMYLMGQIVTLTSVQEVENFFRKEEDSLAILMLKIEILHRRNPQHAAFLPLLIRAHGLASQVPQIDQRTKITMRLTQYSLRKEIGGVLQQKDESL